MTKLRPTTSASSLASLALAVTAAISFSMPSLQAATLTYDADIATAGAQDGSGLGWNTTNTNWYDGAADVLWPNTTADTAIFGAAPTGVGAAVTVGTVNVGTIQFNATTTTGYTLSPAAGSITLGTGIVNNNAALSSTISAKISGSAGLAYSGTGTGIVNLTNAANDYTGITMLTGAGRIGNGSNSALGSSAGASASALGTNYTSVGNGTGVTFTGQTVAEAFVINGTGGGQGALRFTNNSTLNSFIQLGSNSLIFGSFASGNTINGNIDLQTFTLSTANAGGTINGVIGGTGSLTIGANSTVNLTNTANSFSGNLSIGNTGSTLGLGANGVLGTSTLIFNSGGIQSTDATARTIANTIGTFAGNATFGPSPATTPTNVGTLNFTYNTAPTSLGTAVRTFTANVDTTFATSFSNTGGITKLGAATLTLNGASTYAGVTNVGSGSTTVGGGTLLINNTTGSGTGVGAVNVSTASTTSAALGGTLGGTGTIGGIAGAIAAVTVNNFGVIAPGDPSVAGGIGTLTVGSAAFARNVVFGAGSAFNIQVSGATSDLLSTFGGLDLTAAETLNVTGALDGVTSYLIATYTPGSLTGTFDTVTGLTGNYFVSYATPGSIFLAVPEPSTYALILGGAGMLFMVNRRRRQA